MTLAIWGVGALAIGCCALGVMLGQAHAEIDALTEDLEDCDKCLEELHNELKRVEKENRKLRSRLGRVGA